jgi:hypothetical protein
MRIALTILLASTIWCGAQPIPRAARFAWAAPTNTADVIAYELQWGPQDKATVPLYQLGYEVQSFPYAFRQEVSVRSLSAMTNSEPTSIIVYNLIATLEESRDGATWTALQSHNFIGELETRTSMMRVKLSTE